MEPFVRASVDAAHIHAHHVSEDAPASSLRPGLQIAAVASLAGLRDSRGDVPFGTCVLVRTAEDVPVVLSECAVSVLLEVDGVLSLQEIAEKTKLSLADTMNASLVLLGLGFVDAAPLGAPPGRRVSATMLPGALTPDEVELCDDDVTEVRPVPRSGTYALSRPRETSRPLAMPVPDAWASDDPWEGADTSVSDVIGSLARLSDESSIPSLRGVVEWSELAPPEAWLVSIVPSRMTVAAIMKTSPLGDEATLRVLASLISARVITLVA